jgi:uncharacterized protein
MRRSLILFARAPSAPGKTRLTAHLAPEDAAALRRRLLLDTFTSVRRAHAPITIAFTPEHARDEFAALFESHAVGLIAQRGRDLGSRMQAAINDRLAAGATHVVLIGSDLPNLPPGHIDAAFAQLEAGREVVLGPAEDGGYYLIGMCDAQPAIFRGIDWGTPHVLTQTLAAAARAGLDVGLIEPWYDVDEPDDWKRATSRDVENC